jgi:3-oxoacid CoA-transferase B subunit
MALTAREIIPMRIAKEFKDGMLVNLGVGIPTLIPGYLPKGVEVWLESENGIIGYWRSAPAGTEDKLLVDASKKFTTILPGGSIFDSATSLVSFARGHLDYTILGALQVDNKAI